MFGSGDLDPALGVHAARACHHEITMTNRSQDRRNLSYQAKIEASSLSFDSSQQIQYRF